MNNSIILQVDESTKGIMEEIQAGLSNSIEDGLKDVKDKVKSVDVNTDTILRKFMNFDGLSSTIEQLRYLADESKKFAEAVSPMQNEMSEIKEVAKANEQVLTSGVESISTIIKKLDIFMQNQSEKNTSIITEIQVVLNSITEKNGNTLQNIGKLSSVISQLDEKQKVSYESICSKLDKIQSDVNDIRCKISAHVAKSDTALERIEEYQRNFIDTYTKNEQKHTEMENSTALQFKAFNQSIEKLQVSMDIVINLVTPFWKKWQKR